MKLRAATKLMRSVDSRPIKYGNADASYKKGGSVYTATIEREVFDFLKLMTLGSSPG
jgi:hypothetical protein